MSEALAIKTITATVIRPPGVTKRQMRLAALLPRCETAYEALKRAGYENSTALGAARRISDSLGVKLATKAIEATGLDKARGLVALGQELIASANRDELADRDKIVLGLAAVKQGHEIGESVEASGSGSAWKQRQRRAIRLALRMGYAAGLAAANSPQQG